MTQEQLNEMSPTELLNLWSASHDRGDAFCPTEERTGRHWPLGYRVQSFAPSSAEMPNELVVALWVHQTIRSLEPLIDALFADGEDVATVEGSIGERVVAEFFDTDRWSYYKRAKYERTAGVKFTTAKEFGLAVVAKAEILIEQKMEKFPPKLNGGGPDPDVVAYVRKKLRDERRAKAERERYRVRKPINAR
ncbi:hypothetical protein EON81_02970 [bacterium]|nr:MAG: hypothetical protein EON81_02970 [bacterium]